MSLHYVALTDEQLSRVQAVLAAASSAIDAEARAVVQSWPRRSATVALTAAIVPESTAEQAGTIPLATLMRARRDLDEAIEAGAEPYAPPLTRSEIRP